MFTCIHVHNTRVHVIRLLKQKVNITSLLPIKSYQCTGPLVILKERA